MMSKTMEGKICSMVSVEIYGATRGKNTFELFTGLK